MLWSNAKKNSGSIFIPDRCSFSVYVRQKDQSFASLIAIFYLLKNFFNFFFIPWKKTVGLPVTRPAGPNIFFQCQTFPSHKPVNNLHSILQKAGTRCIL